MTDLNNSDQARITKIEEVNETTKKNNNNEKGDIYDNILDNQIQKRAFLTNVPSNINYLENKQKLKELKHLKDKKKSLLKQINSLENKKNEMNEISFNNIEKAKIDSNMFNSEKKNTNLLEKNLIDKLNEIKLQIKTLDKNNENLKGINEEKMEINKENKKFDESVIKEHFLNQNRIRLKEIENKYKNMQKELLNEEKNIEIKRKENLKIRKEEEIKIIKKRKDINKKKMEEIKMKITNSPLNNNNHLFQKMEQKFEEREKKLIHDVSTERRLKNILYKQNVDLESEKIDFQKHKNNLEERAKLQTSNLKKLWHSRSMILKPYQKSISDKTLQNEEIIITQNVIKKGDRKKYSKIKVKLPPINEKLKKESEFRQIDIKNLKGKERINFINQKYMKKSLKILNAFKNLDYGKKYVLGKAKKLNNLQTKIKKNNSQSLNRKNVQNSGLKNLIIPKNKSVEYNIKKRIGNINQKVQTNSKESKEKNKKEFNNWKGYMINKGYKEVDTDGLIIINKKIERLDEKVRLSQQLMKINGGYENDTKLGKEINNILIDSIKGKLAILDELYIDNISNGN